MASLTELLTEIGDDNLSLQQLQTCMTGAKYNKGVTTVTFITEEVGPMDLADCKKTALIVWIDGDKFDETLNKFK